MFVAQNSARLPALLFGSGLAGVPFVPVNYRLADEQLCAILARTAPAVAVVDDDAIGRISGVDGLTVLSPAALDARLAAAEPAPAGFVDPDEIAVLLYTSGTTGDPKAAVLRHKHLASYVISTVEFMGADDDHAALVSVPPYHVAGMATILTSVYGGRRLVYLPQFDPQRWVDVARDEGITHAMVVPTMLGRILDVVEAQGEKLPACSTSPTAAAGCRPRSLERALELLPAVGFVNAYGLTETASTVATLGPDDHRAAFGSDDPAVRARLGSVGRPLPTLEVEIRDDDGTALPAGERGEIYVRGEQVAGEYLGRSALTDRRLVPDQRRRLARRRRLPLRRGPPRRRDRARRREHVSRRDRGHPRSPTRRWPKPESSASPTTSGARPSPPPSFWKPMPRRPSKSCRTGSGPGSAPPARRR